MGEEGSRTTRARRPAAAAHDRTFSPVESTCLEEEFPRFAAAIEKFPSEISKDNIRQCYNDYQRHIDWFVARALPFCAFLRLRFWLPFLSLLRS